MAQPETKKQEILPRERVVLLIGENGACLVLVSREMNRRWWGVLELLPEQRADLARMLRAEAARIQRIVDWEREAARLEAEQARDLAEVENAIGEPWPPQDMSEADYINAQAARWAAEHGMEGAA